MASSKQCTKCNQLLPAEAFSKNRSKKDGLNSHCKQCHKQWQLNNPHKTRSYTKRWSSKNKARHRARSEQWRKNNPDRARAKNAKRRALKRQAIPPWASLSEIQKHYAHAQALNTMLPDCRFEVDHIFPLKSDFVCGLHVENNLMVLEASQNASKNNQWWPGQLPCQTGSGPSQSWWNELNK